MRDRSHVALFGVALFLFSAGFPPLDDAAEVDLTLHMVQHILIILAGVAIVRPLFRRERPSAGCRRLLPGGALLGASILLVFWHIPLAWDAAVLNPWVHLTEHGSFLVIGALSGSWILLLSDSKKVWALMAAFLGHMVYAVVLISPWNTEVYALYSLPDQQLLGWILLLTGPSLLVGVAYIMLRNPEFLAGFGADRKPERESGKGVGIPSWTASLLTVVLVIVALGYFGTTLFALGTSPTPQGATVAIVETPVSWQFTPQTIRVVLGVNSTVTWVSRSFSFDSVQETGGSFSSGPIGPGQTWSHTFSEPGTYSYYCTYHPWMKGTVVVVS